MIRTPLARFSPHQWKPCDLKPFTRLPSTFPLRSYLEILLSWWIFKLKQRLLKLLVICHVCLLFTFEINFHLSPYLSWFWAFVTHLLICLNSLVQIRLNWFKLVQKGSTWFKLDLIFCVEYNSRNSTQKMRTQIRSSLIPKPWLNNYLMQAWFNVKISLMSEPSWFLLDLVFIPIQDSTVGSNWFLFLLNVICQIIV